MERGLLLAEISRALTVTEPERASRLLREVEQRLPAENPKGRASAEEVAVLADGQELPRDFDAELGRFLSESGSSSLRFLRRWRLRWVPSAAVEMRLARPEISATELRGILERALATAFPARAQVLVAECERKLTLVEYAENEDRMSGPPDPVGVLIGRRTFTLVPGTAFPSGLLPLVERLMNTVESERKPDVTHRWRVECHPLRRAMRVVVHLSSA